MGQQRKIAGFFRQIQIISWKNLLLYRKNISGLLSEVIFSCLFTLIFVILVYYSKPQIFAKEEQKLSIPVTNFFNEEIFNTTDYYYYPNNEFIRELVINSSKIILAKNAYLKLNYIGANYSNAEKVNETLRNRIFAFVAFNFSSFESIPEKIEYTIFTKE